MVDTGAYPDVAGLRIFVTTIKTHRRGRAGGRVFFDVSQRNECPPVPSNGRENKKIKKIRTPVMNEEKGVENVDE